MTTRHRALALLAGAALTVGLTACSTGSSASTPSATTETSAAAATFPVTLTGAFGDTVIDSKPVRVAAIDAVDQEIALSLGVEPVISQRYGDYPLEPHVQEQLKTMGISELATYDATDGTDFEAVAAAKPDVILATSGWELDAEYEQLAKIAPVVAYTEGGLNSMSWADRTLLVGQALGLQAEAEQVIADVDKAFSDAAAANPQFAGKSYIYSVIHPDQISFINYDGADNKFFTDLGFVLPEQAAEFSESNSAVSKENLDKLEADVLLIGYPFGDEAVISRSALESDPLFQSLSVVKNGGYAVLGDDVASPLAYPTPLSQPWVLEQILPLLQSATGTQ
ncbi:MAG: ABC transporter substrate-binding protein [Nakamurella sp.]